MVGAMADWFAVTALFKHPLGLPIPHTALIPKRKDELGRGLQEFVGENFLQEDIIRDRVAAATISLRVGRWLDDPVNVRRVVDEAAELLRIAVGKVTDEHVAGFVQDALVPRFHEEPISPMLGGLLDEVVRDDLHHGLVDLAIDEVASWLVENPDSFAEVLGERAPWWAPPRLNDAVTRRAAPRARRLAARHPSRPHAPRSPGARLDAASAGPRPPARRRHPGPHREAQGPAARPPAGARLERGPLERAPQGPAGIARRPRGCGPRAHARRADGVREAARSTTQTCASGSTCWPPTRRCSRSTATAPSSPRSSPTRSSAGTARRPRGASSCTSAATCSSSGSTAPSSVAWSASSSTPSRLAG